LTGDYMTDQLLTARVSRHDPRESLTFRLRWRNDTTRQTRVTSADYMEYSVCAGRWDLDDFKDWIFWPLETRKSLGFGKAFTANNYHSMLWNERLPFNVFSSMTLGPLENLF
jgi:hypothetical protein